MVVVSCLVRLVAPFRSLSSELATCRRITWFSIQRCHMSDTSYSSSDNLSSGLERYTDLQRYFNRRLRATHNRFSSIPDQSMVYGRHHVYFIESDAIYRMDKTQSERKPEQVLNLKQVSQQKIECDHENVNRKSGWTVQRIRLSPQEKHLAATVTTNHREEPMCVVVKLGKTDSLRLRTPHIICTLNKVLSFEWATDEVLFYTTLEGLRCSRVYRLDLTSSGSRITSVYEEMRPDVFVEVALSRDQQIMTINCSNRTSSEVLLIDLTTSHLEPFLVLPRQLDLLYYVEHWQRLLIILANTGPGQEYQVLQAPLSEPSEVSWVPLFTPHSGTTIKDMDVVGNHCVLVVRMPGGELALIVFSLTRPEEAYTIELPSWACAITSKKPGVAEEGGVFEFLISSPVHPPAAYCLYPKDGLLFSDTKDESSSEVQGACIITRLEACSKDGTSVPVTLFHTVPFEVLREVPLLVHVYGAYGQDLNMEFSPEKRLLLEQGWALAYCHIRGGGELGLSWQRQARVEGKERGLEDLHACLQHIFSLGVSSPSITALTACSAGATPVGALCNKYPHMARAVTLQAPFLDVLGTMEDPSLPLTVEDREEWGDPVDNHKHRQIISLYCPSYNITPQCYPSMLLTAYSGDARIPLTGVIKYTKKLKNAVHTHFTMKPKSEFETVPNIVLNIQSGASHHGPDDFKLMLEEEALRLAFLYTELGLDPPRTHRKRKR